MTDASNDLIQLSAEECRRLLASHRPRLGRIAFVDGGWPMVFPMNFVADRNLIYFKTASGSKLFAAVQVQQVSFEVDHIDARWQEGWSVLALGRLRVVTDPEEVAVVQRMPLEPWARGDRPHYLRLDVSSLSGRRIINP
jgi:nitroimidazol reductase NimA-like FMN-containing flavoprotein (pyridoxamine 5'-phosphate oxidase superfamily)